jgi:threonine dehydrogenase-like Zn-dependent dehydrogenase
MTASLALAASGAQLNLNGLSQAVPLKPVKAKSLIVRAPRGRSYRAVELALATMASGRFPVEEMCTHRYGLKETHTAILATAGRGAADAVHVVVEPTA